MIAPLKRYADFQGRSRRMEYWMFALFIWICYAVIFALVYALGGGGSEPSAASALLSMILGIFALGIIVPSIAVTVRRLHDTDRSGWWILISFLPFLGGLVLFVFTVLDGTPGTNKYGPDPKGRGDSKTAEVFA
jgi:uncharacterized membrane protein YhaH (DUF805 family)